MTYHGDMLGTLGMVFVLLWMTCASSSPNKHKSLSDSEKAYLERTIPGMNSTKASRFHSFYYFVPVMIVAAITCSK